MPPRGCDREKASMHEQAELEQRDSRHSIYRRAASMGGHWQRFAWGLVLALHGLSGTVSGQVEFEQPPIQYGKPPFSNPVHELQQQLAAGEATLRFNAKNGYLESVLEHLNIDPSSQVLVNSKTSFQLRHISPRHPRAIYFNDESYVGWVQQGDVVEIMTTDPLQGAMFYTLSQQQGHDPRFMLDKGHCMTCHATSRTQRVPGGLVRSVFVNPSGQPQYGSGTFNIDHRSPFEQRWGGWYVTGTHGDMRHMGNVVAKGHQPPEAFDRETGANLTGLSDRFDVTPYLTPHSDLVALMVLEHQTQMQNYLTRASYESRSAAHYDQMMNDTLDRPADHISESTIRREASAGDDLLRYLLFAEEFALTAPVRGTSEFAKEFSAKGPRDSQGRSLREFDLQTRMFKYPCSYMIYSRAFDRLPARMKQYVATKLHRILTGDDESQEFSHLTKQDRQAILEILSDTKPELWDSSAEASTNQGIPAN
jgi:hypothetical protein